MTSAPPASLADFLLGLVLGPIGQDAGNRLSLEGLTVGATNNGAMEIGIRRLEAASLRVGSGPFTLEIGRFVLEQIAAQVGTEGGRPRLRSLEARSAELAGARALGPLALAGPHGTAGAPPAAAWSLAPLAAADGTIRAEIVDAHLLFDADVTVRVRQGQVDFKEATVEHVGPDSRMGASRLGVYVDAPNGRSYLYQFASSPVPGVEYERRGAMLGPFVTDRGRLQLQPFGEWVLREARAGQPMGLTEQARLLFDRTAVAGDVQLGDGRFAAPGLQADLAGRAEGRNVVRLHSEAVGRGLTIAIAALSARNAVLGSNEAQLACDHVTGALTLRLFAEGAQLRFAFDLPDMKVAGLRLRPQRS